MRWTAAALLLPLLVGGCGDKSKPAGGGAPVAGGDAGATGGAQARPGVAVTAAWSWGDPPKGEHGPRMRDPNEPLPTGPALIAAGKGKLVVATQDSCIELLDGKTGKPVVPHRCEKDAWALGLAVLGDVAIVARQNSVHALSLDDLHEVWRRETGVLLTNEPLARPAVVDGRFCLLSTDNQSGVGIRCFGSGGEVGHAWTIGRFRVAFGERLVGLITDHRPGRLPEVDGVEMTVEFYTVDRKLVAERPMSGQNGPRFVRTRPIFAVQASGKRGWTTWFVDPDGRDILTATGKEMLRGGALVGKDVVTSEFISAPQKDSAVLLRAPAGASVWRTDLAVTGPWDPFAIAIGKNAFLTHGGKLFALDAATGAIAKSFDLESEHHGVWQDKVLFLVSSRESRSDSDFGDAAVYAVDAPSLQVVLRDELGKDVPGGQQASDPVFDGDMAYAIAGGRVHAYRIATAP